MTDDSECESRSKNYRKQKEGSNTKEELAKIKYSDASIQKIWTQSLNPGPA